MAFCNAEEGENMVKKKAESHVERRTDLVEVLAQQSSGLRGRQVTEFGHKVHLPLGEHTGRSPQLSLSLSDGLILVLNSCIQSLDCLVQLEKCSLLLQMSEGTEELSENVNMSIQSQTGDITAFSEKLLLLATCFLVIFTIIAMRST